MNLHAQTIETGKRHASRPEIWWAVKHLFIAKKSVKLTRIALIATEEMKHSALLDGDPQGGQVDAFRHSYWMALLAQKIHPRKALMLGIAHEKGNYLDFKRGNLEDGILPDKISASMDLYNNEKGVALGYENRTVSQDSLKQLVIQAILEGKMKIVYKDVKGQYLQCNDSVINLQDYRGKWEIPKCRVRSNHPKKL